MTISTNVPPVVFTDRGYVAPDESLILAGVQADQNAAFGGDLNPDLTTPQGQQAQSTTAIIGESYNQFIGLANGVDPAYASGRMQDAIGRIYFIERKPAQSTVVDCLCTGLPSVVIPVGAQAVDLSGLIYACVDGGVIGIGGNVTLSFACATPGPIPCPADSLNAIYRAIPGWDTINNPSDGVIGSDVESRADFEFRRASTVAGNSFGAIGSIIGAVSKVAGVLDYYGYDNGTGAPVTVGGVSIAAHSIYICVVGGTDQAVAQAILSKKSGGCGYTGNTTETVYDSNPLYAAPIPYSVTFERPTELAILFAVRIQDNSQVPADAATQIQNAIINAFSGGDGGPRARIGTTLFASRFYATVAALGTWAEILDILIGSNNNPLANFTASMATTNMTVTVVASGTLAAGQTVSGAGVIVGTKIVSQTSGPAGGTGVYVISNTQTVGSEAMIAAKADSTTTVVDIDQVPTISAAEITVTLV